MVRASLVVLALLLSAPVLAQDEGSGGGGSEEPRAPRRPLRDLKLAPAPEGWTAAPQAEGRGRRRFLAEYTLPAAAGQAEGPKVTVLAMGARQAHSFDEYRGRLVAGWTKPDGSAVTQADQTTAARKEGDLEVKTVEQTGSFAPARGGAEKKDGMKLVAVWVRQGEDRWSIWLMGTAEGVEQAKQAFLTWVDTAQPGEPLAAGPGNNSGGGSGGGQGGGEGGGSGPY